MSYTPGIPTSKNSIPAQDRSLISQNFTQLNTQFAIDHTAFNAGSNNGFHKQITYQAPLTPSAPAGSIGLEYTKTVNAISELHFRNATKESQITFSGLTTASGSGAMPGGLQIRSGQGATGSAVTFSPQFPTTFVAIVATAFANGEQINITSPSATGFTGARGGGGGAVNFFWIATGY